MFSQGHFSYYRQLITQRGWQQQWHIEACCHCFFCYTTTLPKRWQRSHVIILIFFFATQLIVWRGGWQQWYAKAHRHCFLFCYNTTLRKGQQHGRFFFLLQHNSQSEKEDDDDNINTLKHVAYVFCFALVQFREKGNNMSIYFLMQCNSQWEKKDNDNNKLKHIDVVFCFTIMQLYEKDDDMGVFFYTTQLTVWRGEGQQLHVIVFFCCSTTLCVNRKTMTMTC